MANNKVYTEAVVTLNGEEAKNRISELTAKAAELRQEMARIAATKGIDSKEFKKVQKELVNCTNAQKKLNEDTAKFQKIINNINGSSINELQSAAKKLEQQMRRLKPSTDEFIAASKKLKEVRGRMEELQASAKKSQSVLGGFFSKIGWAGLLSAAGAAVVKFGKDLINTTQTWGDKWGQNMAGMQQAYQTFIADLASGKGWSELIANMKESFRVGKEVQIILDELFERNNALALQEAEYNVIIEENKKIMRDTSKTAEERLAAANLVMEKESELARMRRDIASDEAEANKTLLKDKTGLTDAEIEKFVVEYNNNRELIQQAMEYSAKRVELEAAVAAAKKRYQLSDTGNEHLLYGYLVDAEKALAEFENATEDSVKWWADVSARYDRGNDELVNNYVNSRVKMVNADAQFHRDTARAATQAGALRKQIASENQAAVDAAYKEAIRKSEEHFKKLEIKAKEAYANGEISQQEYNARIATIQENGLKEKLAIAERYKQSTIQYQTELLNLTIKQKEEMERIMAEIEKDSMAVAMEIMEETEQELETMMEELAQKMKDELDRFLALQEKANEIKKELDPIKAIKDARDAELAELEEMFDKGLLTEEEYLKKRKDINLDAAAEITQGMHDSFMMWTDAIGNLANVLQEAEMSLLDARMEAELTAAGDNAEQRAEIEEKYEQEKLELQKKYANINMGIQIAQTLASGAMAIVRALADLGPVAGGIMAGIIGATTAAQVAVIIAQRNAIMNSSVDSSSSGSASLGSREVTGYEDGGYTGKAPTDSEVVGVVHSNEWVAPAAMVRANPVVFARLESARRSKNYRSTLSGFAEGGMAGADAPTPGTNDNVILKELLSLLKELRASLPLPAYVLTSEINKENEFQSQIKKIAGKKP